MIISNLNSYPGYQCLALQFRCHEEVDFISFTLGLLLCDPWPSLRWQRHRKHPGLSAANVPPWLSFLKEGLWEILSNLVEHLAKCREAFGSHLGLDIVLDQGLSCDLCFLFSHGQFEGVEVQVRF